MAMLAHRLICAAAIALCPGPLRADGLQLCNQSFDVLNVAIGVPDAAGQVRTRGWWRVAPNQCATLLREALSAPHHYVFAADVFGNEALTGAVPLCVAPRRFDITGQQDCLLRGYLDARFVRIDTGDRTDWTVFASPRPE